MAWNAVLCEKGREWKRGDLVKIIVATKNQGKMKEIKMILSGCEIVSMGEAGIDLDVEEDGASFEENAVKKAMAIYRETEKSALGR